MATLNCHYHLPKVNGVNSIDTLLLYPKLFGNFVQFKKSEKNYESNFNNIDANFEY